jgi:nicotinic acid mononucleotide adenylyltransferase
VSISTIEESLPQPSYSINTVVALKKLYPGRELSLLIGGDQLVRLHTWHQARMLIDEVSLVVVGRCKAQGQSIGAEDLLGGISKLGLSADLEVQSGEAQVRETGKTVWFLGDSGSEAESTMVRDALRTGNLPPKSWMDPAVLDYICVHKLLERVEK